MLFLYSTVFQTWKTTFQLYQADSFTQTEVQISTILHFAKFSNYFEGADKPLHKSYYLILLQSAPERHENGISCSNTCKGELSGKLTHLQYGNQAAETTVSKPCHNSYICLRLFWHILLTPTLCWSMQFEEDWSYTPPNPQKGYYNPF